MTDSKVLAAASNISTYLLGKYGSTMCSDDLAEQLHTTPIAVRVGLCRGIDLPAPDRNLPGRGHRWLTIAVAEWFADRDNVAEAPAKEVPTSRRSGRPRKGREISHV